ncbi:LysR substrate-binding domain-containing protein [Streptomyces sp. NRRL F-5123]|uniref:LysR substrate-binding domain-containing protein n=1 Tax=Streptomyces sp. NRRL F-5123 TaxID=1463856 RepID=UPI0004E10305|nr:LysR substrate-binding domain-containing protein [Streptomyces sp. NRRL F-5123]
MDLLRHLRLFVVVAEELHFSRAADIIGMAQPPLSQSIRRLERHLGAELFDRSRRHVRLTPAGVVLLAESRRLLAAEQHLRTAVAGAGEPDTLRVGVPPQTSAAALHALLTAGARELPGLLVEPREGDEAEQLRLLRSGDLDVGLLHHPLGAADDLVAGPAAAGDWGVVLHRASAQARRPEVDLAELSGHDLVLFPRPSAPGWYDEILAVCRAAGFTPAAIRHAGTPEFLLGLVASGHGVAFGDGRTAAKEPRTAWRPLAGRPLRPRMSAVWPRRKAHPAASAFARTAARALSGSGAADPPRPSAPDGAGGPRPWSVVFDGARHGG